MDFYPVSPRVYAQFRQCHPGANVLLFLPFDIELVGKFRKRELIRDDRWCQMCKVRPKYQVFNMFNVVVMENGTEATVDHVIPRAMGGPDIPENIQLLCNECNRKKADTAPVTDFYRELAS